MSFWQGGCKNTCFRVITEFDFPPTLVVQYCSEIEKRMMWDEDYDYLNFVRKYKLDTTILHVKVKAQWPLGPREVLLLFQGFTRKETGDIYLGAYSIDMPEIPVDPTGKITRMQTISGHYVFLSLDGGKRTRLIFLTEFNFGGNVPKSLVQSGASDKFIGNMVKLKKLLLKENPHM